MITRDGITIYENDTVGLVDHNGVEVCLSFEIVRKAAVEVERWQRIQKEQNEASKKELADLLRKFEADRVGANCEVSFV